QGRSHPCFIFRLAPRGGSLMCRGAFIELLALWSACAALAQEPVAGPVNSTRLPPLSDPALPWLQALPDQQPAGGPWYPRGFSVAPHSDQVSRTAVTVTGEQPEGKADPDVARLRKEIEVLQQQLDVLRLRSANLAVQARQSAQRDQELASAVDDLREQTDADR